MMAPRSPSPSAGGVMMASAAETQAQARTDASRTVPEQTLDDNESPPRSRETEDGEKTGWGEGKANEDEDTSDMSQIALKALHVDDDPTLNPWTFRMFFLGISLAAFGSALATIFLFKPQSVDVSIIFLTVISYIAGHGMSAVLPRTGFWARWLNPHPFNSKEHLAIVIMSGAASSAAYATEVLATQKLYYDVVPNAAVAILLLFSSQLLGYGMAGVLRKSLVYPTRMLWPTVLPLSSLIETLHRDRGQMKARWNFFWLVFCAVAVWELLPQYVMPILTGISVFCLANPNSQAFTNIFGGSNGNEGLGLLSLSLDFQYITTSPLVQPLVTLTNGFAGYLLCATLFLALYYGNVWEAQKFPFLSTQLFSANSTADTFSLYNQSAILDASMALDPTKLATEGLPSFTATNASYLLTTNLGISATLLHVFLWYKDELKSAFNVVGIRHLLQKPRSVFTSGPAGGSSDKRGPTKAELDQLDPHYRQMLAYKEVPSWWYMGLLALSTLVALGCIYALESTLPWWGFGIAVILSFLGTLFFGALSGTLGFTVPITNLVQLIGGYLHPGQPVANMYFVLFGANAQSQALQLVGTLKLGQYGKLAPRCVFLVQTMGTLIGAVLNYVLMSTITTNQRDVLMSIQGTNIWSGQAIQSFNSNAIAFGALSSRLFSIGRPYQWVVLALPLGLLIPLPFYLLHRRFPRLGLDQVITPVVLYYMGYLAVGINSSVLISFLLGFFFQAWVRRRHPRWFLKYNYLLAAAISGGTELLVFLTTFTVQGGSGAAVPFPKYWGNNLDGNFDLCMLNPALASAAPA